MQTLLGKHWHHMPAEEILHLLETDAERGLDLFEIQQRQARFGLNRLTPRKGKSPLARFLLQFNNPLIYILLASAAITAFMKGEWVDASVILGVVLINAIIGFVQEARAEQAIEALAQSMSTTATVIRSAKTASVPSDELIPGDIVVLKAGDKVPADLRLLRSRDLKIAEAALTGESLPVDKDAASTLPPETELAERRNMAYTSALVTYGQGIGVVTATGDNTEVGRISRLLSETTELETPLTREIARFSRILMYAILGLSAAVILIGLYRGTSLVDAITAGVALAVAAIPEGLPAALTVTLAIGVARMARRRAIIRKLPAVETLGSVTVICSDKTGTLTQNQMTVKEISAAGETYLVGGSGYNPQGEISDQDGNTLAAPGQALQETLKAGLLCNDSGLEEGEGRWEAQGDPTETALIVSARKAGYTSEQLNRQLPRLDTIPFDSQHQYMASLHDQGAGLSRLVYLKGAAEVILERCSNALDASGSPIPLAPDHVHQQVEGMAKKGLRVLAFARAELPAGTTTLRDEMITSGLTFLGMQAMIDPPRAEAIEAVQACHQAGIRVKMITGDHALTAAAIAGQLGLVEEAGEAGNSPAVVTGRQLENYSDEQLIELVQQVSVFARVSPEQKLRLVQALQASGEVTAMTGDGVNDGPALKQSDIGVAMGITGTEVAKEAADMVLTDDNFATIRAAVEEGRGVFDNLTRIIAWTLPTNIGEGLVILLAIVLNITLPILPVQILWINMVTVAVLGLVLALENKEPGVMSRPPRDPRAPLLTRTLLWRIVLVGLLMLVGAFGLFEWELQIGASVEAARTAAVNAVVIIATFYLFNSRSLSQPLARIGLMSNPWALTNAALMVLLQLAFTYTPFMNRMFHSAPIEMGAWVRILVIGLASFLVVELEKVLLGAIRANRGNPKRSSRLRGAQMPDSKG